MELEKEKKVLEISNVSKKSFKLNSCGFISDELFPIVSMDFSSSKSLLAVARESINTIEIYKYPSFAFLFSYNLNGSDLISKVLFHNQDTLIVICKNSMLYEFSLDSLIPLQSFSIPGGALNDFCWNPKQQEYIIACDDGTIKLYDYKEESSKISFSKVTRNFKSKALACSWDDDDLIAFYSCYDDGMVRKFDRLLNVSLSINLLSHSKQKIFAWKILSIRKSLVCGCSNGTILFFETDFGTLIKSIDFHQSDILTLITNSTKTTVYASGSDSRIVSIENLNENAGDNWMLTSQDRGQSHDVYSLALINDNLLISAGLTTDLCLYNLENNRFIERIKISKDQGKKKINLDENSNSIKLRHITTLHSKKLIQMTESSRNLILNDKPFNLEVWEIFPENNSFKFLFEIRNKEKAILSSCISLCGTFLAFSTHFSITIYHIIGLKLEKLIEIDNFSANALKFSNDSNVLFFVNRKNELYEYTIQNKKANFISALSSYENTIFNQMELSFDDDFIAIGSKLKNCICIFKENEFFWEIPKIEPYNFTCFKFSPFHGKLFVIYENHKFAIFNLKKKSIDKWSLKNMNKFPLNYLKKLNSIIGIAFHMEDKNKIIIYSNFYYIIINLAQKIPKASRKIKTDEYEKMKNPNNFDIVSRKYPILFLNNFNSDEYILFQNSWNQLLKNMPGAINTKKFGN